MESSCAPYKYCDQSGGGLVYSTLPYHLRSYISDDWSKSSDSNKKLMYLDPHRRLFKDMDQMALDNGMLNMEMNIKISII